MYILEVIQQIEVETPKGKGRIIYVTDYGMEIEKLFTIIITDTCEIWEFTNKQIKVTKNFSFERGKVTGPS